MHDNLSNRFYIKQLLILILLTAASLSIFAQDTINRPPVTASWDKYLAQVKKDSTRRMVELKQLVPGLIYDLRYAGTNNFMKRRMYPEGTRQTYLRLPAALALKNVQLELNKMGLGLKIFDAYRPYSVTVRFWELVKDERYVANPSKGSGHNRGIAVDLTLVNSVNGQELDMGTGFDNFSDTAHHSYKKLSAEILKNRNILRSAMEKNGFRAFESEWWHYFIPNDNGYEILDLEFKKLKKNKSASGN